MKDFAVTLCELGAIACAFFSGGILGAICATSFLMYINMTSSRKSFFTLCSRNVQIHSEDALLNIGCFFVVGLCGYFSLGLPGVIPAVGIMLFILGFMILIFDQNKVPVDNNRSSSNEHVYTSYVYPQRYSFTDNNTPQFPYGHYYNTFIQQDY